MCRQTRETIILINVSVTTFSKTEDFPVVFRHVAPVQRVYGGGARHSLLTTKRYRGENEKQKRKPGGKYFFIAARPTSKYSRVPSSPSFMILTENNVFFFFSSKEFGSHSDPRISKSCNEHLKKKKIIIIQIIKSREKIIFEYFFHFFFLNK